MDDPSRDTKSMDDMVFDEVNNISRFNFSKRYNVSYRKDEPMTSD